MYQYVGAKRLGMMIEHPPEGVPESAISTRQVPLTHLNESGVWTKTWQMAWIVNNDIPGARNEIDHDQLDRLTRRIEEIWTRSPKATAQGVNSRVGLLAKSRDAAVATATHGEVDLTAFFAGAPDIVADYLRFKHAGSEAASILGQGLQGYVRAVVTDDKSQQDLLVNAIDHLGDAAGEAIAYRETATVDEFHYLSYLGCLYIRTAQWLVRNPLRQSWSPPLAHRLQQIARDLEQLLAQRIQPTFAFGAQWNFSECVSIIAKSLASTGDVPTKYRGALQPALVETVRDMGPERAAMLSQTILIGNNLAPSLPWFTYLEKAGSGTSRLGTGLKGRLNPVSVALKRRAEEFLASPPS